MRHQKPNVSVVITAHNEGDQVIKTVRSITDTVEDPIDIILIDDGSTDGSCERIPQSKALRTRRHELRKGIGASRNEGCTLSKGDVIAILDGHQLVEDDSLSRCAALADSTSSIVCPDTCDTDDNDRLHGAFFSVCVDRGYLSAEWKHRQPKNEVSRVSSLKAPAYFIPRNVYPSVRWSSLLRGWGGSEASISLKAFFAGVDILHLCGPVIRHRFKKRFHYDVGWGEVWRNQAIIVRTCFDDRTWHRYWLPEVFEPHLTDEVKIELESDAVKAEQLEFARYKVRSDQEFWTQLIFRKIPASLT